MGQSESARKEANEAVWAEAKAGDLIEFPRSLIHSHFGVKSDRDKIIHLMQVQTSASTKSKTLNFFVIGGKKFLRAQIKESTFENVLEDSVAKIVSRDDKLGSPTFVEFKKRQDSMMIGGIVKHCDLTSTCEHFAVWLRYGKIHEEQNNNEVQKLALNSGLTSVAEQKKKEDPKKKDDFD